VRFIRRVVLALSKMVFDGIDIVTRDGIQCYNKEQLTCYLDEYV
jgi:hypothetical protein